MKRLHVFASVATIAATMSVPVLANGPKGGKPAQSHASSPSPKGGQASHDSGGSKHGPSATAGSGKSSDHGSKGSTSTASSGSTSSSSTGGSTSGSSTTTGSGSTQTGTTASTPTFPPNAISTKISKNPNQLARVQAMLPAKMTIEEATSGFRNQGQFIAAVNVSKNRNIPFVDLKKAMTEDGLSLGQAARQVQHTPAPTSDGSTTGGSTTGGSTTGGATTGNTSGSTSGSSSGSTTSTQTTSLKPTRR